MNLALAALMAGVQLITYPHGSEPVVVTVAESLKNELFPTARVEVIAAPGPGSEATLRVAVASNMPWKVPAEASGLDGPWMYARIDADGDGWLIASDAGFLYAMFGVVSDKIESGATDGLETGILIRPQFEWITGREDVHMSRLHYLKRRSESVTMDDVEASFREAARLGCTHVIVNEPTSPFPHESGPAGEIYYRFYAYALDFDQYVETELNAGTYPPDLLEANLALMKRLAKLAAKYGLTPGMFIANPRSVPESLLDKYPYLRGARVDHTFRAFEPRYTLTLAHPLVRWHYAEMLRKLLKEVPELGFVTMLLNDSGSGFEYTASLYPGRNGGPYIVREWRPDDEIARKAAENVLRYYQLLRNTAHEINPDFRVLTGLKNIAEEAEIILGGIDDGIDVMMRSQRSDYDDDWYRKMEEFRARGSEMTGHDLAKGNPIVIGVPAPWHIEQRLENLQDAGYRHVGIDMDPIFLAEPDVNREVLRAFQLGGADAVEPAIEMVARAEVGEQHADKVLEIWRLADRAVSALPKGQAYAGQSFVWFRIWVRPLVPDIGKIPEADRAYYQNYILSVFNNPHNVDFGADALWTLMDVEQSDGYIQQYDTEVWAPLDSAITLSETLASEMGDAGASLRYATDLRDRLLAYKSYCRSLRNIAAWVAGVHGYLDAKAANDEGAMAARNASVREMVADEIENTRELLALWERSNTDFIPITEVGETMHTYGTNLGDLLRRKIALMEQYGDAEPYIDPDYMWRLPDGSRLDGVDYLKY